MNQSSHAHAGFLRRQIFLGLLLAVCLTLTFLGASDNGGPGANSSVAPIKVCQSPDGQKWAELTFSQSTNLALALGDIEVSEDLKTWVALDLAGTEVLPAVQDPLTSNVTVTVRIPFDASRPPARFFRFSASAGGTAGAGGTNAPSGPDPSKVVSVPAVAFAGFCPPITNSMATLAFNQDFTNDHIFHWASLDSVLGSNNTVVSNITLWRLVGSNPQRLVFRGTGGGASFYGDVLFEPYNRAVVDMVKGAAHIRYLLKPACLVSLGTPLAGGEGAKNGLVPIRVDLEVEGVIEEQEETVGRFLAVNNDDDNGNQVADNNPAETPVAGENDLVKITLRAAFPPDQNNFLVRLNVEQGTNQIRIWTKPNKETLVDWQIVYYAAELPREFWVEGFTNSTALRDVEMVLESVTTPTTCQDRVRLTVLKVELELTNTGRIVASPENEDYAAETNSAGGTDQLGPLPMGQGRGDFPGQAYTSPIMVIGNVFPKPVPAGVEFRWKRMITRRSWFILKNAAGTEWDVTQRTRRINEDDTGMDAFNDPTPSTALGKIYIYDCSALLPAIGAGAVRVGDFIREEKAFRYSVEFRANGGAWVECAAKDVGQIIRVRRQATTGNVADDWDGLENGNAGRVLDAVIDETEVRGTVGGTLLIVIDANANN